MFVKVFSRVIGVCLDFLKRNVLRVPALFLCILKGFTAFVNVLKRFVGVLEQSFQPLT